MKRGFSKKFLYCKQKAKVKKPCLASSFEVHNKRNFFKENKNIFGAEEGSIEGVGYECLPSETLCTSESSGCTSTTYSSTRIPTMCPASTSTSTHETGKRKFQESWLNEIKWISYDKNSDTAKCSICSLFPNLCNKTSKVVHGFTSPFKLETFRKHGNSRQHLKCVSAYDAEINSEASLNCESIFEQKMFDRLKTVFSAVYYLAKNNKPFSDIKELLVLMNKCGHDVLQLYGNAISCKEIVSHISMVIEKELLRTLQNCSYVSLLFDTYINSSGDEEIIIYVRYMKDQQVQESFISVVELQNKTAQCKLDTVKDFLTSVGLENLLAENNPSLIGVGTDGAESLVGKENGLVTSLLNMPGLGHLVTTCCVVHKLNVSILNSIKNVKYLEKIDEVLKELYKFYCNSPKRLGQLKEVAELLFSEILKFRYLSDIKWIASRLGALNALINNYQNVVIHLEDISTGKESDTVTARSLLKELKNFRFVVSVHFLLDFLRVFNSLSLLFQKTDHLLSVIQLHVEKSVSRLEAMKSTQGKMEEKVISTTTLNGVFEKIQLTGVESSNFKTDKQNILESGITFLKDRFLEVSCTVTHSVSVFDTFAWPSESQLMNYGEEKIRVLGLHFNRLLPSASSEEDILDSLLNEWHEFKVLGQGQTFKQLLERTVLMCERFPILSKLLSIVSVMPVSALSCERGFSLMNLIENKFKNGMELSCLKELMMINLHGPKLEDFDPSKAIDCWWFSSRNS